MSKVKAFFKHIRNFNGKVYTNNTIYVNDVRVAANDYEISFLEVAAKLALTDPHAALSLLSSLSCEIAKVGKYDALVFNYNSVLTGLPSSHKFIIIDKDNKYVLRIIENAVYADSIAKGSVVSISIENPPKAEKVQLRLKEAASIYGGTLNVYNGIITGENDKRLFCVFKGICEKNKPYHFSLSIPKAWGGGMGCIGLENILSFTFNYFSDESMEVNFKSWSYNNLLCENSKTNILK